MTDILYGQYVIKLKRFLPSTEWIVTVRSLENKTVASNWLESPSQAEQWAKSLIEGLEQKDI